MRQIGISESRPGTCQVCTAKTGVRTLFLGESVEVKCCALCRGAIRQALVQAAGSARDALREEARADAA